MPASMLEKVKSNGGEVVSHFDEDGLYHRLPFHDFGRPAVRLLI
jgi:hypothetical protein